MNKKIIAGAVAAIVGGAALTLGATQTPPTQPQPKPQLQITTGAPQEPNSSLTPGYINPSITQDNIATTICKKGGYTNGVGPDGKPIRNVSDATKSQAFKEYGIDKNVGGPYEIDHLISLELGGANDIKNLWPQSYVSTPYNAHMKDALENKLHSMVCANQITLSEAQKEISTDWIAAYKKYVTD